MSDRPLPPLTETYVDPRPYPDGIAYLDGQFVKMDQAKISVLDYGFLHSDATYDVVHVWDGAFFRLDAHLDRFFSGMDKLHMSIPENKNHVAEILHDCVALSGLTRAYVEVICTRGSSPTFSRDPRDSVNRLIAFAIPFGSVADPDQMKRGLHVAISDVVRIPPQSVDSAVKNYHWLDLVRGLYDAYAKDAETAILLDTDGNVAEGPGFNLFALIQGALITPAHGVLPGITRRTVMELAGELGVSCTARALSLDELFRAEEVFITSTAGGVMPVGSLNNRPVGRGGVGPMTEQMIALYWGAHRRQSWRDPVAYTRAVSR